MHRHFALDHTEISRLYDILQEGYNHPTIVASVKLVNVLPYSFSKGAENSNRLVVDKYMVVIKIEIFSKGDVDHLTNQVYIDFTNKVVS